MSKVCELTGKRPISGNNVSHAMNKTRRRFLPNLQKKRFFIPEEFRKKYSRFNPSRMSEIEMICATESIFRVMFLSRLRWGGMSGIQNQSSDRNLISSSCLSSLTALLSFISSPISSSLSITSNIFVAPDAPLSLLTMSSILFTP